MRNHISQLYNLSLAPSRRIIGLMSGTSLDGLDVVLCRFDGCGKKTTAKLEHFETVPYDESFKEKIRTVFSLKTVDLQQLTLLNVYIAEQHAGMVLNCLKKWVIEAKDVDLLASHGQTVYHAPRWFHGIEGMPNATLQLGDGDHLAVRSGIITVSDFRQKHLAAGGEGAPLALYGDYFMFSQPGEDRILLNIGGIANFTWLPGSGDAGAVFATDCGPGNTLLDAFARELFEVPYDRDALLARAGVVEQGMLENLLADPFFDLPLPKSTGPELFTKAWIQKAVDQRPKGNINPYNLMATLTALSATTIAEAVGRVSRTAEKAGLYLSGGGAHNPLLRAMLEALLPDWPVYDFSVLGISGDAKEAVLFAALANETVAGEDPEGALLGGVPLVGMGKISFPG